LFVHRPARLLASHRLEFVFVLLGKFSKFGWYWRRLQAMSPGEVALRLQKRVYQFSDSHYSNKRGLVLEPNGSFPRLPEKRSAPAELLDGLSRETEAILRGNWMAFGHLPLKVDDPPKWQFDYLIGKDFQSGRSAFKLDHRAQPGGADIKIIWEPNRWYQLVRLSMAAWLLDDMKAGQKCIEWLRDWIQTNPPFTGLNWTSGLETGIRLVQFAWIDLFLTAAASPKETLAELRRHILPPHYYYTWRYKSFGSSANNHLLGELAGLIVAQARWPDLASLGAPLPRIAALWGREVLAQFAPDGGNNEQALGYHLFSSEFCWQSQRALLAAGISVSEEIQERIAAAGEFYSAVKPEGDPWDFGDTDNAWVTPLFASESHSEWWRWFNHSPSSPSLQYWWGTNGKRVRAPLDGEWRVFQTSGYAVFAHNDWFLRFDFSPLGYLSMAPHGHLDALHLSVWHRGVPVIIDPGTGAYYADQVVRSYLAGWAAHNGPQLKSSSNRFPERFGTFLWSRHHSAPRLSVVQRGMISAELELPSGRFSRSISFLRETSSFRVSDHLSRRSGSTLITKWKFAPDLKLQQAGPDEYTASDGIASVRLQLAGGWNATECYNPPAELGGKTAFTRKDLGNVPLDAIVSPAFRKVAVASYLVLESSDPGPQELTISAA
jgi:hypothetical protein